MLSSSEIYRVLLVEDSPADAASLSKLLAWGGSESHRSFQLLRWETQLAQALEWIAASKPDLVLLDLTLPKCTGIEAFLRVHDMAAHLPVIVLSDLDDEETALRIVKEGAQDYVVKSELTGRSLQRTMLYAMERDKVKRMEEALQRERNLLRSVIDNVPDFIQAKDTAGRYILNNLAHVRWLEKSSPEDLLGKSVFDFFPHELAEQYHADDMAVVVSRDPIINKVEPTLDKDGSKRWISTTKVPIVDGAGGIAGIATISRDITQEKIAKEQIEQVNDDLFRSREDLLRAMNELQSVQLQLIEAEKMKLVGRLAAGVAHEVKNPLAIIAMGMDYMTRQEFEDPNIPIILFEINEAVARADSVVRGLLDFSAPKKLHLAAVDLNEPIRHALRLVRGELDPAKFKVIEELEPNLPQARADAMKIEQVFVNLFTNAIHAMEAGGTLTIRTSTRQLTGVGENISSSDEFRLGDRLVVAEVMDTGHGLPEASVSKIFEPFFTTKPTGKGTGLGLTVTKTIIDLHGGTISACNRPEGGVCIMIVLRADTPI